MMDNVCDNCGTQLTTKKVNDAFSVVYCENGCFYPKSMGGDYDCRHEYTSLVKREWGNTQMRVQYQCDKCKRLIGNAKSCKGVDISKLEWHDEAYRDSLSLKRQDANDLCKELWVNLQVNKKELWFKEHSEYLSSFKWKEKRKKVLYRDRYLCQACLENAATEVHHITYSHWKNEPLFDLVSVCKKCHDQITEIDRTK